MECRYWYWMKIKYIFLLTIAALSILSFSAPTWSYAQQNLPKTDVEQLKKISTEAKDIETLIVLATPHSLAQARSKTKASLIYQNQTKQHWMQLQKHWPYVYGLKMLSSRFQLQQGSRSKIYHMFGRTIRRFRRKDSKGF